MRNDESDVLVSERSNEIGFFVGHLSGSWLDLPHFNMYIRLCKYMVSQRAY